MSRYSVPLKQVCKSAIKTTVQTIIDSVFGVGQTTKYHLCVVALPQTINNMNTPSLQVSLEHAAWFGHLPNVPKLAQRQFVELIVDAHCDKATGESIQHMYSTLAILQQALYCIVDEDAPKLGTWEKKGSEIDAQNPNTWKLRGQLNDAFTTLLFLVQDAWQRTSSEECKQIFRGLQR